MDKVFGFGVRFGGVVVNVPDSGSLLGRVSQTLEDGRGFAIATLNLDHLVKLRRDPAFRAAYLAHDLVVADGNPVVWLSRLAGRSVRLAAGSDLVEPLARVAAQRGAPVALVGSTDAALASAAAELRRRVPGLVIAARLAPPFPFDPDGPEGDSLIEAIGRSGARMAFIALGAPRQERFAARCRRALPGLGLVSVGAGIDFLAGDQRRAPAWVRALALEWVWRLALDPRRLGPRYAACALMLPSLVRDALAMRLRSMRPARPPRGEGGADAAVIDARRATEAPL